MQVRPAMPRAAVAYIAVLALAAVASIGFGRPPGLPVHDLVSVSLLALMLVMFDSTMVPYGSRGIGLSMSSPVALASYQIGGPWGAAVVGASAVFVLMPLPLVKRVFNASQAAVTGFCAGAVFLMLGGTPGTVEANDFPQVLLPVFASAVTYLVLNGLMVAGIVGLIERVPVLDLVMGMSSQVVSYLGYGIFGLLMTVLWVGVDIGPLAAVLVLLPLIVARWAINQYGAEQEAYQATIRTLVQAVETKDPYTRGHSERVAHASVMIARTIGMRRERIDAVGYAGILHDVGKLGVPTTVLQKSAALSEAEFAAIKLHPVRGLEMLSDIEFLDEAFQGILHHHERMDGSGYPMGLRGDQIPTFARVIAVADAFDSMTSTRSYRDARTVDEALRELELCKGAQFDPDMVDALVRALAVEPWAHAAGIERERGDEPIAVAGALDHDDPAFGLHLTRQER